MYAAYTFPSSNKTPQHQSHFQIVNQKQSSSGSIQSDHSGSGGHSEGLSLSWGSGSSGSYRKRMKQQQQQQHGMYSIITPIYANSSEMVREKTSRPASRSASRKESFKEILAQLQMHNAELKAAAAMPPPQPHLVPTPQLKHVPSFHMEDLNNRPGSRSGSSDYQTNRSNASDLSRQSLLASNSTVTSLGDHQPQNLSYGSAASFGSDVKLQEVEELLMPPAMFVDERSLSDIPAEQLHVQSQTVMEQTVSELPVNTEEPVKAADLQVRFIIEPGYKH